MLQLVKGSYTYKNQIIDFLNEWYQSGEKIVPYAIRKIDYSDFDLYLDSLEVKANETRLVPDSTYFLYDTERDIILGAVNIRHYLNEMLLKEAGHIGDGIRPSERRKGYATHMIKLALEKCKAMGIHKVLMVCDKSNIGSSKSIINNGGVLEDEPIINGVVNQRYWIDNK